jgi:hypothetical protein
MFFNRVDQLWNADRLRDQWMSLDMQDSQRLHFCAAWNVRWPFAWNGNLWSVKSPRSLLKQMSSGVKFDLIKDEDLSRDKPDCETDHQGA